HGSNHGLRGPRRPAPETGDLGAIQVSPACRFRICLRVRPAGRTTGDAMPLVLGADLGTTKITALALDTSSGEVAACCTLANQAEITKAADKSQGYSEWDARQIVEIACACLRGVAERLGN